MILAEDNFDKNSIEGVYLIKNYGASLVFDVVPELSLVNKQKEKIKPLFRIKKIENYTEYNKIDNSNIYYYLEEIKKNRKLYLYDKETIKIYSGNEFDEEKDKFVWVFTEIENGIYYIQNKYSGLFLGSNKIALKSTQKLKVLCSFNVTEGLTNKNKFILIKMYDEVPNKGMNTSPLLENEPIDVLIKYIDLKDPNLERGEINQIQKHKNNEELKYSIRSVLQNLPWVRKIFILMPNEKVRFLKDSEYIKEKIIYVKDKDVIGFNSDSSPIFQFNLYKMKKFGMSENFLLMDDDYFIGKYLNKSNFFYEEKGEVYPSLTSFDYYEINYKKVDEEYKRLLSRKNFINPYSKEGFYFSKILTLRFIFPLLQKNSDSENLPIIAPGFTHNTISLKMSYIKEVYDLIEYNYEYEREMLSSITRNLFTLQPQILFQIYMRNMYQCKVNLISYKYIDIESCKEEKYDTSLFVINTEDKNYSPSVYIEEKKVMQSLFPNPHIYELNSSIEEIEDEFNIELIEKRINNAILNLKTLHSLNYDYIRKRRSTYRNNYKIRKKINKLGRKNDELQKNIPELEKRKIDLNHENKKELLHLLNNIENDIKEITEGYNEIKENNSSFFTSKKILLFFFILLVATAAFFIIRFFIKKNQIIDFEVSNIDEDIQKVEIWDTIRNYFNNSYRYIDKDGTNS